MINILELRPGNWIRSEGFLQPIQVTAHNFGKIKQNIKSAYPIEITTNILSGAGFELKTGKSKKISYWQKGSILWHTTNEVYLWNEANEQLDIQVKFVHQLQNIYFYLNGSELEISLNPDLNVTELYGHRKTL